jgi:hypothetical protein
VNKDFKQGTLVLSRQSRVGLNKARPKGRQLLPRQATRALLIVTAAALQLQRMVSRSTFRPQFPK